MSAPESAATRSNLHNLPRRLGYHIGEVLLFGAVLLWPTAGCHKNSFSPKERKFIESYCEMMRFNAGGVHDSVQYRSGIDSILARHGLDRQFMKDFVDDLSGKTEIQRRIFTEISRICNQSDSSTSKTGKARAPASEIP